MKQGEPHVAEVPQQAPFEMSSPGPKMRRMGAALHFFLNPSNRRKVVEVGGIEFRSIKTRQVRPIF